MRNSINAILMAVLLLVTVACSGGDPETPPSPVPDGSPQAEAPGDGVAEPTPDPTAAAEAVFTTGDLENMLLAKSDAPSGMEPGEVGLETPYGSGTFRENKEAAGYGLLLIRFQSFATPSASRGGKMPKVSDLGVYSLGSSASVYEDAEGAEAQFNDPAPKPEGVKQYIIEPLDDDLGDQARRITWREKSNFGGSVPYYRVSWRRGNARLALEGYGVKNSIDEEAMLALARQIDDRLTGLTGGAPELELPEFTGGEIVRKDTFNKPTRAWKPTEFSNASSGYRNGKWAMASDEGGYSVPASQIKPAADLDDTRIAFEASVESREGGIGAVCRYGAKDQHYVASVFTDDTALIGYITGGRNSRYVPLANVEGVKVGKGPHELQLDCVGNDLVRLQLQLDGEIVAEGLDLKGSSARGRPGMFVEAFDGPVEATFDNLTISQP